MKRYALEAGRLRHRVRLEELVTTLDDNGVQLQEWQNRGDRFCAIEPLSGREYLAAASIQSKITGKLVMRYRPNINARHRIVKGQRIYNIEAVLPDPDTEYEYVTLLCSEGVIDS